MDKEKIEKQAKQILDKFADALSKVESRMETKVSLTSHLSLGGVDREEFERIEGEGVGISSEDTSEKEKNADKSVTFKQKILNNAPEHDEDFILVEKGVWKS